MGRRSRRDANGSVARVILIDSSAWIEFLRDTGSTVCNEVDELLDAERLGEQSVLAGLAVLGDAGLELSGSARDDEHGAVGLGRSCRDIRLYLRLISVNRIL